MNNNLLAYPQWPSTRAAYHRAIAIIRMCKSLQNKEAHGSPDADAVLCGRGSDAVHTTVTPAKEHDVIGVGVKLIAIM
ncbi:MAG TPA: hypothetical protein DCL15_10615 [Chloroflexi bacterium]|nr:hypothetical protein [Chloroflexota bacterium]